MKQTTKKPLLLSALLLTSLSGSFVGTPSEASPPPEAPKLALRISLDRDSYKLGEPISLRVEITNMGKEAVFMGSTIKQVEGWIYSLRLIFTDPKGKPYPLSALMPPFVPPPKESFTEAFAKNWVPLQPGYFYGRTITLDEPFLSKPGQYKLYAIYQCMGMYAPLYYNTLAKHPEEIRKLPYTAWEGIVESNTLSFQVTP